MKTSWLLTRGYDSVVEQLTLLKYGYQPQNIIATIQQGDVFVAAKTATHRESLLVYGFLRELITATMEQHLRADSVCDLCCAFLQFAQTVVVKRADKATYQRTRKRVREDICKEAKLMRMFMLNSPPIAMIKLRAQLPYNCMCLCLIVRFYDFLEDERNFYLVMERGGMSLFECTLACHKRIAGEQMLLKEWKRTVRYIFSQMVSVVDWMHSVMHCCNMDLVCAVCCLRTLFVSMSFAHRASRTL